MGAGLSGKRVSRGGGAGCGSPERTAFAVVLIDGGATVL